MEQIVKIIKEKCPHNHKCRVIRVCPVGAISQKENEVPQIDYTKCISCGKCSKLCPKKVFQITL